MKPTLHLDFEHFFFKIEHKCKNYAVNIQNFNC